MWEESPPTYQSDVYYFVGSSLTTWTLTWTKVCRAMCRRKNVYPRRYTARDNDIFALIKHQLCDDHLSQPALLIWPGDNDARKCSRSGVVLALMLVIEQCCPMRGLMLWNHWRKLWKIIRSMVAPIRFYRGLANGELPKVDARPLDFINVGGVQAGRLAVAHALPPRDPRPNPYELRVRFRRGRGRGWWS